MDIIGDLESAYVRFGRAHYDASRQPWLTEAAREELRADLAAKVTAAQAQLTMLEQRRLTAEPPYGKLLTLVMLAKDSLQADRP
jgi:hypothetical protein